MLRDRRRFYRWPVSIPCIWESEEGGFPGRAINLSFGGARIESPHRAPREGSDLLITLHLQDYSVNLSAHVFYVDPESPDFGIEFYGNLVERTRKLLPLFRQSVPPPGRERDATEILPSEVGRGGLGAGERT